jgi:polysaccharide export outer membrane protein
MKPRFPRLFFLSLALAAGLCLVRAGDAPAPTPAPLPAQEADYNLQASDLIRVEVFQEDGLKREVRLSQDYTVTLPLIGTISLKGMTVRQANDMIQKLYDQDYLVNPQVSVSVLEYSVRTVNVLGAVTKAGAVTFPPEQSMNLLDAIAGAGGFTRLADRSKIKLTRQMVDGKNEAHIIDADEIIQGQTKKDWPLQKGDVIYVPERVF